MGCCGGHFEMHDDREKRAARQDARPHSHGAPSASARPEEGSLNRWIAPLVLGLAAVILYFVFR